MLASWNEVYARRGSGIRSLPDLAGRRVAVLDNSTQQDYLLNMAKGFGVQFEIVHFPDFASAEKAWRAAAQRTVDDAEMKYVVVHLHRLLEPELPESRN